MNHDRWIVHVRESRTTTHDHGPGLGNTVCGSGRLLRLGKPERFVMPATRRRTVRMVRKARRGGESRWRRGWRLLRTRLDGQEVSSSSSAWGGPCLQDHASCVRACRSVVFGSSGSGYGYSVLCGVVSREVALATDGSGVSRARRVCEGPWTSGSGAMCV